MKMKFFLSSRVKLALILPLLVGLVRCQVHFDCPQLPPLTQPARTVHELRPQDIKVVMALGDSITAGIHLQNKMANYRQSRENDRKL